MGDNLLNKDQLQQRFQTEVDRWFADRGDQTLRLDYPLNSESVVVDLGGYEGKWSKLIFDRYFCNVHVFEPVPSFCENIRILFSGNSKVKVYESALGDVELESFINLSKDSTSMFEAGAVGSDDKVRIKIESIHDFLKKLERVDLVKINIEGAEYDLLDSLHDDELKKIKNLQVQFHTFYPDCQERRNRIHEKLSISHKLTYNYDFVWENWELK